MPPSEVDELIKALLLKVDNLDHETQKKLLSDWNKDADSETKSTTIRSLIERFSEILEESSNEEEVHQFVAQNEVILTERSSFYRNEAISGMISKFPITPDRIVDFFVFHYDLGLTQGPPNRMKIIELKQPKSKVLVQNSRMSKDLNDAWMECTEATRLLALNYKDVLRRSAKAVRQSVVIDEEVPKRDYGRLSTKEGHLSLAAPSLDCEIFIGRRGTLSGEQLDTLRALMNHGGVSAYTYDHLIDRLKDLADRRRYRY